ncbi:MAG: Tfp pilus assembly protein FimT/FimU [Phycisphaerales bacterium]
MRDLLRSVHTPHAPRFTWRASRRGRAPAFTLVEMLVVMLVMSIVALLTVPAFNAFSRSNTQTQAEEALKAALRAARDAALDSSPGEDVVAVFVQPLAGSLQVVLARRAGTIADVLATTGNPPVVREVFVPIESAPVVSIPRGYAARGYVGPGVLPDSASPVSDWYVRSAGGGVIYQASQSAWVAPETHYFKQVYNTGGLAGQDDGADRNTFMMRFEGGTGAASLNPAAVLVVLPRNSATGRDAAPWMQNRLDVPLDALGRPRPLAVVVDGILNALPAGLPASPTQAAVNVARRQLLGHESSDTVLAGPVPRVAVYEESRLAATLGTRVDRLTGTLYWAGTDTTDTDRQAAFYDPGTSPNNIRPHVQTGGLGQGTYASVREAIDGWLLGDTNLNGTFGDARSTALTKVVDLPVAKVFMLDRTLGEPVEVPLTAPKVEAP